jgi:hypothetical protein
VLPLYGKPVPSLLPLFPFVVTGETRRGTLPVALSDGVIVTFRPSPFPVFQVRVVADFMYTPPEHFAWGFALYGSEGSLDVEAAGGVRLRDITDLLGSLVLRHFKKEVCGRFFSRKAAWCV